MPPAPSPPRLTRIDPEEKQYGKTTYRRAIKKLLGESGGRCGYSMQHIRDFGNRTMEVDHFNPTLPHPPRNRHGNMIAASRHCNGFKSQQWPNQRQEAKGLRFLNPYKEADYGDHILEDPKTGELVGITRAGRWHIEMLDLNADFLMEKRRDRTELLRIQKTCAFVSGADKTRNIYQKLIAEFNRFHSKAGSVMIPPIPYVKGKVRKK